MTTPYPIVVLISGNGSNLQAIIDAIADGNCAAQIKAVISDQTNAYGIQRAKQARIETQIVTRKDFASRLDYDMALASCIKNYAPQLIVLAGFMRILSPEFVHQFPQQIINIHPSLLPKYPGLHTYQKVLAAGDSEHGSTVHLVTEELDAGPIIAQAKVTIQSNETEETLKQRTQQLEYQLYPQVIDCFANDQIQIVDNSILLDRKSLTIFDN